MNNKTALNSDLKMQRNNVSKKINKIIYKLVKICVCLFLLYVCSKTTLQYNVYASSPFDPSSGQIANEAGLTKIFSTILGLIQYVGIIIAVIVLILTGVKYFTTPPSKRAEISKQFITYIIAAFLLFGASAILALIKNIVEKQ